MKVMEGVKIVVDSFKGFFVWLIAMLGLDVMDIPFVFGAIVTIAVGLNALFTLRNHINAYLKTNKNNEEN